MARPVKGQRRGERGNSLVEFALVVVFLVPLMMGVFSIGMSLTKSIQAGVVARDAGNMFMKYMDFTLASNKAIIVRIANGMGMTANGGNGAVVMSQIMFVGTNECAAGGLSVGSCPNYNRNVFIKRMTVGNTAIFSSPFGTPSGAIINTDGTISTANYLTSASAVANGFSSVITLNAGEYAYVSEAYFLTPEIDMPGYRTNTSLYQRNIF